MYKSMIAAFSKGEPSCIIPYTPSGEEIFVALSTALGDNPEVVYFNSTQIDTEVTSGGLRVEFQACLPKAQALKLSAELDAKAESITAPIRSAGGDPYTQLIKIYEYLQKNVRYDQQEYANISAGNVSNLKAYNAYGALIEGKALCGGFAAALGLLAKKLGFQCMTVSGYSSIHNTGVTDHGWNIVKVGTCHYHMDVTWDTCYHHNTGTLQYNYFALTDDEVFTNHDWNISTTPPCTHNDLSFYVRNKLIANNKEQLENIFRAAGRNIGKPVYVKLSENITLPEDSESAGNYLMQLLQTEAEKEISDDSSFSIGGFWNDNQRCFFGMLR